MQPYVDVVNRILTEGVWKTNRTQYRALTIAGASATYDCSKFFPMLTLKAVPAKSPFAELTSFLKGATSAAIFRENGTKIWDQNANQNEAWLNNPYRLGEDDLGPVYGASWRKWPAYKTIMTDQPNREKILHAISNAGFRLFGTRPGAQIWFKEIDQLYACYRKILDTPDDRRILFHAWNPANLDEIALPACHLLYQFIADKETRTLDLCMTQRSCDTFLGVPFNIASCAALLLFMAKLTGYKPGKFVHHMNDVHIYENAIDGTHEMLARIEKAYPTMTVSIPDVKMQIANSSELAVVKFDTLHEANFNHKGLNRVISELRASHFDLQGYDPHPAITVDMAV